MAIATVCAVGGLVVALTSVRAPGFLGFAIALLALALSMGSFVAVKQWWGDADEAVKEAHKTGWYWGSTGGLSIAGGLVGALFALRPDVSLRQFALFEGDAGLIATGVTLAIGLAFIGYGVGWAAWWLVRGR